jgi:hypothetical protein
MPPECGNVYQLPVCGVPVCGVSFAVIRPESSASTVVFVLVPREVGTRVYILGVGKTRGILIETYRNEGTLMKTCPECDGARRIQQSVQRSWWEVLLFRPATTDELCPNCVGAGWVFSSPDEEERIREESRRRIESDAESKRQATAREREARELRRVKSLLESLTPKDEYPGGYIPGSCGLDSYEKFHIRKTQDELIAMGPRFIPELFQALRSQVDARRCCAGVVLSEIGDANCIEPLMIALDEEIKIYRRRESLFAVAIVNIISRAPHRLPEDRVLSILAAVRRYVFDCHSIYPILMKLPSQAATTALAMCLPDLLEQKRALDSVLHELVARVYRPENDEQRAWFSIARRNWDVLVEIGRPAVGPLCSLVKPETHRQSYVNDAIRTLARIGEVSCVTSVLERVSSQREWCLLAIHAIRDVGNATTLKALLECLTGNIWAFWVIDDLILALKAVLQRDGRNASREILSAIAALPPKFSRETPGYHGAGEYKDTLTFDCSAIIAAAEAELKRRN